LYTHGHEKPHGFNDMVWDYCRGYIEFPDNITATASPEAAYSCFALKATDLSEGNTSLEEQAIDEELAKFCPSTSKMGDTFADLITSMWAHDPEPSLQQRLKVEADALASVAALTTGDIPDPTSYSKAVHPSRPDSSHWIAAIKREIDTLVARGTWEVVPKSVVRKSGKRPIRCKLVFKKKLIKDGSIKYKARLVACGYSQQANLDYSSDELYASVCSYSSMRYLLSLATQKGYHLFQTDVEAAYLQSVLTDEIYMDPPPGSPRLDADGNPIFLKLKRGLYGLRQGGFYWSQCFKEFMTGSKYDMGFRPMTGEPNLYRKSFEIEGEKAELYVGQYVDDCLVAASSTKALDWFMERISDRFPINPSSSGFVTSEEPGLLLSMHVKYDRDAGLLSFNQLSAIEALAKKVRFGR